MHLASLRIRDFRNIAQADLNFYPGLNLVIGSNGQGKSNLLEAVGILATGRSFRRAPPQALRRHGQPMFRLEGHTRAGDLDHRLEFQGYPDRQTAHLNGKPMTATSAMGQALAAVIVTPETLRLVQGSPTERRAYLDWLVFSRRREHAPLMRDYRLAVRARNLLLQRSAHDGAELAAWEDRLAVLGARVTLNRRTILDHLTTLLTPYLRALAVTESQFEIHLSCQLERTGAPWSTQEEAAHLYRQLLLESRARDCGPGVTTIGPHRDEWLFRLNGRPLARYGSQGQQKRFILALKLAEGDLLRETLAEPPVFLLDDPAAELDRAGFALFMEILAGQNCQIFISTCQADDIPRPDKATTMLLLDVHEGRFAVQ
ncbi:MAG: DNA replication/repair protein RecF [Magnetococcales bacterium]|nr:DNA replication/repair protein RecF [Magnetococcales bacterium]